MYSIKTVLQDMCTMRDDPLHVASSGGKKGREDRIPSSF